MVSADTIRTVVGILGNFTALGLFLSPVPTFYRIWKKGSVEQFSPAPYLATLLNCMLWVVYGLPLVHPGSTLVVTINASGSLIELFYVFLFILYSERPRRLRVLLILLAEITFAGTVAVSAIEATHDYDRRSLIIGILCVFFGTMMYAAPLSVMKLVIHTKSVEYMPLFLSIVSFFNGVCWTIYALLRFDIFIIIPNGLGVLFAVAQLVLHAMYHKSTRRQIEARKSKSEMGLVEVVVMGETSQICKATKNGNHPETQNT